MEKLIIFATLIFAALASRPPQFEQGYDQTIQPSSNHVLFTQAEPAGRSVDVRVNFKDKFAVAPQVIIGGQQIDWWAGPNQGILLKVQAVDQTGFVIRAVATGTQKIWTYFFSWIAIDDPRVVIQHVESTTDVGTLDKALGNTLVFKDTPINFGQTFSQIPAALLLFQGAHFKNQGNNILFYDITKGTLTTSGCTVRAYNWGPVIITQIRFSICVGDVSVFWASPVISYRAYDDHPWLKRAPGAALLDASVDLPPTSDPVGYVYGPLGWVYASERNCRVLIHQFKVENNKMTAKYGTWYDTILIQLNWQFARYRLDSSYKIREQGDPDPNAQPQPPIKQVDPPIQSLPLPQPQPQPQPKPVQACAVLYSQCSYQGKSVDLCDRINSFPDEGWNWPVRSIRVPPGKTVTLYTEVNLVGQKVSYTTDQECLSTLDFRLFFQNKN